MKIDSSNVGMESARKYRSTSTTIRKFTITDYQQNINGNALDSMAGGSGGDTGNTQDAGNRGNEKEAPAILGQQQATLEEWQGRMQQAGSSVTVRSSASQTYAAIRHRTVNYIFNLLFASRRNRWNRWRQENGMQGYGAQQPAYGQEALPAGKSDISSLRTGEKKDFTASMRVLNYTRATIETESESTVFSTTGTVRTSDGRSISFNVNVGMSREFQQYYEETTEMATFTMCDPLVINLDTELAQLSDQTFYFDIDGDGEEDEISKLGQGSGYLALDKNGDGAINDGNELFGAKSGNGFADLAQYDEDGNGWIDENDAVWGKLKIWCKDENGNDILYSLADKGVGAICLRNTPTDFTLKGEDGQTRGAVRNTGIFLYENGNTGTVQHLDVAKYSAKA